MSDDKYYLISAMLESGKPIPQLEELSCQEFIKISNSEGTAVIGTRFVIRGPFGLIMRKRS